MATFKKPKKDKNNIAYTTATNARKDLFKILDSVHETAVPYRVTKGDQRYVLLTEDDYDDMLETIDILGDEEFMSGVREGIKDIEEGRTVNWEEVKKELDL